MIALATWAGTWHLAEGMGADMQEATLLTFMLFAGFDLLMATIVFAPGLVA